MREKNFYDIHCHALNLSHPYLLAFLGRLNIPRMLVVNALLGPLASIFVGQNINKVKNMLSVMENDICGLYLLLEDYLRQSPVVKNGKLHIGGNVYSKIILTPLMMDFGYKSVVDSNIFYKTPSRKPIVNQVLDVFNGIREYRKERPDGLFEIYPFLGINTNNYPLYNETSVSIKSKPDLDGLHINLKNKIKFGEKTYKLTFYGKMSLDERNELFTAFKSEDDKNSIVWLYENSQYVENRNTLPIMLDKYFSEYNGSYESLALNLGKFDGNIENIKSNYFAGIKVYPPLGFDPWPDDEVERGKVSYMYDYCCKKGIPITTHCNDSGFTVISNKSSLIYTSPERWAKVSEHYPTLKLNFAHMGGQKKFLKFFPKKKWMHMVFDLIKKYDNVYADFAYSGVFKNYYNDLRELLNKLPDTSKGKIRDRILFGSDFVINLMDCESYNRYTEKYSESEALTDNEKDIFCRVNPEKFLFN